MSTPRVPRKKKLDKEALAWIDSTVDNLKMIRSEGTKLRVKALMLSAMAYILNLEPNKHGKKGK